MAQRFISSKKVGKETFNITLQSLNLVLAIVFPKTLVSLKPLVTVTAGERFSFVFRHVVAVVSLDSKSFATHFTPIAENASMNLVMETNTGFSTERLVALRTMVLLSNMVEHTIDVVFVLFRRAILRFPRR